MTIYSSGQNPRSKSNSLEFQGIFPMFLVVIMSSHTICVKSQLLTFILHAWKTPIGLYSKLL